MNFNYTEEMLGKETMAGLVNIYNNMKPVKQIKKFKTKKSGIQMIIGLQGSIDSKTQSDGQNHKIQPKQKKVIRELLQEGSGKSNKEFSELKGFISLCRTANTEPTKRQASKFRSQRGLAYQNC